MDLERFLLSGLLFFFAIFWLAILHAIAWLGGWTRLAGEYPAGNHLHAEKPIHRRGFQSGSFGLMNYNSALNIGIYEEGVRIAVLWPFRPGHAPLFIPWSELGRPQEKRVFPFVRRLEVQVGSPPVKLLLPVWVGEEAEKLLAVNCQLESE